MYIRRGRAHDMNGVCSVCSVCSVCIIYRVTAIVLLVQDEYEFQMLQVYSLPTPLKFLLGASHANLHHQSPSMPSEFLLSEPCYGYIVTYKSGRISGAQNMFYQATDQTVTST